MVYIDGWPAERGGLLRGVACLGGGLLRGVVCLEGWSTYRCGLLIGVVYLERLIYLEGWSS